MSFAKLVYSDDIFYLLMDQRKLGVFTVDLDRLPSVEFGMKKKKKITTVSSSSRTCANSSAMLHFVFCVVIISK